ncbi:MAG: thioesterase domain-containing protein, partial [Gemmatimonadota bacterium]
MLPSRVRVLDAFPRLPNGKVDTAALAELPEEAGELEPDRTPPRTEVERTLAAIWCDVLDLDEISVHDTFFELGGDSILSIHATSRANQQGLGLSPNDIFNFPTIAELATRCGDDGRGRSATAPDPTGAEPGPGPTRERAPLFMVHVGIRLAAQLRRELGREQPLFCFSAHWHRADLELGATVEQLAAECLAELRSLQPTGPYFIGGYSMGAPIALELSQQLQREGERVSMLFVLDPPPMPRSLDADGSTLVSRGAEIDALFEGPPRPLAEKLSSHVRTLLDRSPSGWGAYLWSEAIAQIRWRILRPLGLAASVALRRVGLGVPTPLREPYVLRVYTRAWRESTFMPYDGDVVVFNGRSAGAREALAAWQALTRGDVHVETFEGAHLDFAMDPDLVDRWAPRLAAVLA